MARLTVSDLEPLLAVDDIQGHIVPGFNKDYQAILGLRFSGDRKLAREFVGLMVPKITTLREVVAFKQQLRASDLANQPTAIWCAGAMSWEGLSVLSPDAGAFVDLEFKNGLLGSSSNLGDASDPASPGHRGNWVIGAPGQVPHMLVIVAADTATDLEKGVDGVLALSKSRDVVCIYNESGRDLSRFQTSDGPAYPHGHEHFGFKDGVSQPGVRGLWADGEPLTARSIPSDPNDSGIEYAVGGQPLVCAGQFLLGYAQQLDYFPRVAGPPRPLGTAPHAIAPAWAANGSFLVFRRLRQDVAAFRAFSKAAAERVARPDFDSARIEALMVGRWPSGAPVERTPSQDDPKAAAESIRNNFGYGPSNPDVGLPDDTDGIRCPVMAHVRKVNPRDLGTDKGAASATLNRRILRRGIPYGPPYTGSGGDDIDRGLLFLSYQASIAQQFEFLITNWVNSSLRPTNPSGEKNGLGVDLLIGQRSLPGDRDGYIRIDGGGNITDINLSTELVTVKQWVTATGGGYFFAPSVSAFRAVLSSGDP